MHLMSVLRGHILSWDLYITSKSGLQISFSFPPTNKISINYLIFPIRGEGNTRLWMHFLRSLVLDSRKHLHLSRAPAYDKNSVTLLCQLRRKEAPTLVTWTYNKRILYGHSTAYKYHIAMLNWPNLWSVKYQLTVVCQQTKMLEIIAILLKVCCWHWCVPESIF